MPSKQFRIVAVSIAVGLALWSAMNLLDWGVDSATVNNVDAQPFIYLLVFSITFAILLYFGATKRIFK